jgi:CheY-like chemotaxis protein
MPIMNGYEVARQIRSFNKDIIIIAQTAFVQTGDREKALAVGCNDYISKPINKFELFEKINNFFSNNSKIETII